jgi:hypothetical protein
MNMPDMSREFLEGKCLDLARANIFGRGTERVTIKRINASGSGPNWAPDKFVPPLPPIAEKEVREALLAVAGQYALANGE